MSGQVAAAAATDLSSWRAQEVQVLSGMGLLNHEFATQPLAKSTASAHPAEVSLPVAAEFPDPPSTQAAQEIEPTAPNVFVPTKDNLKIQLLQLAAVDKLVGLSLRFPTPPIASETSITEFLNTDGLLPPVVKKPPHPIASQPGWTAGFRGPPGHFIHSQNLVVRGLLSSVRVQPEERREWRRPVPLVRGPRRSAVQECVLWASTYAMLFLAAVLLLDHDSHIGITILSIQLSILKTIS